MKSMRKSRKYILGIGTIGLFGIAGLLLVPVAICIVKIINRYPKMFGWIFLTVCAFICIYGALFKRERPNIMSVSTRMTSSLRN